MSVSITILGCASSGGVPRVGRSGWGACDPAEPRNRRRRCSVLIRKFDDYDAVTTVLVDMSPDMRMQLLDADVQHLDAVLLTHAHADHVHGIDDVRPFVIDARKRMDVYLDAPTSKTVRQAFGYIFETPAGSLYPPLVNEFRLDPGVPVTISGQGGAVHVVPFLVHHGEIDALGFRVGNMAYSPDVKDIPEASVAYLQNLDVWIIDALRYAPHPSHFSLSDALGWIERMRPKRAILTNLHNDMDYATLKAQLPPHVDVAYDGMLISEGVK